MQNNGEHVEEPQNDSTGPIKSPKQLLVVVVLAFLIPISIIIMLVNLASISSTKGAGSTAQSDEAIAERLQPVAKFKLVDEEADEEVKSGEDVFKSTCASCHAEGVANAPKVGDEDDWAPLIDDGLDTILKVAIEGKGAMPPRGGNANLSDDEVASAIVYMANQSGADWDDPVDSADQDEAADDEESTAELDADDKEAKDEADANGDAGEDFAAIGEDVFKSTCATCHAEGVANAPKVGDEDDWHPLIEDGLDTILKVAIEGKGAMPPRGGNADLSDDEVSSAIVFMANQSGADWDYPGATSDDEEKAEEDKESEANQDTDDNEADEEDNDEADTDEESNADTASIDPAGEKLYKSVCFTCHTEGVAGAPKLGNAEDWEKYEEDGFDSMLEKAISGVGAMPPRGGSDASDEEMKAAIEYMLSKNE